MWHHMAKVITDASCGVCMDTAAVTQVCHATANSAVYQHSPTQVGLQAADSDWMQLARTWR